MRWIVVAGALALSGCIVAPDEGLPPAAGDACGAGALQGLIGQDASVLQTIRFAQTVRIIQPGMMVTQDFSPSRLNIDVGTNGRIARVSCG